MMVSPCKPWQFRDIQDGVQDGGQIINVQSFISGTIDCTDIILVSSIGFSGSENPKNILNSFPNYHVTLKV